MKQYCRNNVYLHFLDRELRNSVSCKPESATIIFGTLAAAHLTPGKVFCSYSHLWESYSSFLESIGIIQEMLKYDILIPSSNYISQEEFLDSRISLYSHDSSRYSTYFAAKKPKFLSNLQPVYQTKGGSTNSLESYLRAAPNASIVPSINTNITALKAIDSGLKLRSTSAITGKIFQKFIRPSSSEYKIITRLISMGYTTHYMSECNSDILTGFPGLMAFDRLSLSYPYYDVRLFSALLGLCGVDLRFNKSLASSMEMLVAARIRGSHMLFILKWRNLLRSLSLSIHARNDQIGIHDYIVELNRRCVISSFKPSKKTLYENMFHLLQTLDEKFPEITIGKPDNLDVELFDDFKSGFVLVVSNDVEQNTLLEILQEDKYTVKTMATDLFPAWGVHSNNGQRIVVIRTEMGSIGASNSELVIYDAINLIKPSFVLMPGIAFGLKEKVQKLGEIIFAKQITDYETCKVSSGTIHERGPKLDVDYRILNIARLVFAGRPDIHFGEVISGCKLVNDPKLRSELISRFPDAIGGEMEGLGLASACKRARVPWLLAKGISDWGHQKEDFSQKTASTNAVRLCLQIISHLK